MFFRTIKSPLLLALPSLALLLMATLFQDALAAGPAPGTSLTPTQAAHTLSILQDDKKRAELEQTLSTIAQATGAAPQAAAETPAAETGAPAKSATPATPATATEGEIVPIELTKGGLVAQIFDLIERRLDLAAKQLRAAVRVLLEIRTVGDWWQHNLGTPERRAVVLGALGEVVVVLAGALLAEWLLRRVLAHPRKLVEDRAATRQTEINRRKEYAVSSAISATGPSAASSMPADRHWSLLRRFPYALAHFVLELAPLAAFLGVAIVLLNAYGGRAAIFYDATLPIVGAYATTRIVLSVIHLMASPLGQGLRLMHISDSATRYLNCWLRRIVVVAVFGTAIADVALQMGATLSTHDALSKLVGFVVHVMLLIMVLRSRKETAAAIRGTAAEGQSLFGLREILADSWPFVATFLIVAMWLLWSVGTENGFQRMLEIFAWSAAVIIGASLVSIFVLGAIDRAFMADSENMPEAAPEGGTKSIYHLLVHRAVSLLIAVVAFIVLLQVWGVDTLSWFKPGSLGRRLASAVATIAVTCALAVAAWEALNMRLARRIKRWRQAGDTARAARLRTLMPMLRTTLLFAIGTIVLLAALDQLGISIAPLLAGASIIGVALGFGSQKLVQDFITGIFLLMENAIQVGDFITVADVSGKVEYLSIRTVRLRASDGALYVVPFSSVSTVTNFNRGIGNASIKVSVKAGSDIDKVFSAIRSVSAEMRADPAFKDLMLADVDIWGVDQVDGSTITILGQIQAVDTGRWPVQRGFNQRILQRFREQDIQFVNPQERLIAAKSPFPTTPVPEAQQAVPPAQPSQFPHESLQVPAPPGPKGAE